MSCDICSWGTLACLTYTHPPVRVVLVAWMTVTSVRSREIVTNLTFATTMDSSFTLINICTQRTGRRWTLWTVLVPNNDKVSLSIRSHFNYQHFWSNYGTVIKKKLVLSKFFIRTPNIHYWSKVCTPLLVECLHLNIFSFFIFSQFPPSHHTTTKQGNHVLPARPHLLNCRSGNISGLEERAISHHDWWNYSL